MESSSRVKTNLVKKIRKSYSMLQPTTTRDLMPEDRSESANPISNDSEDSRKSAVIKNAERQLKYLTSAIYHANYPESPDKAEKKAGEYRQFLDQLKATKNGKIYNEEQIAKLKHKLAEIPDGYYEGDQVCELLGETISNPSPVVIITIDGKKRLFAIGMEIGAGNFGKAKLMQDLESENGQLSVAKASFLQPGELEDYRKNAVEREMKVMNGCGKGMGDYNIITHEVAGKVEKYNEFYMFMPLFTGIPAARFFDENPIKLSSDLEYARLYLAILTAMQSMINKGYLHGDINGGNMLIDMTDIKKIIAHLIDFGSSSAFDVNAKTDPSYNKIATEQAFSTPLFTHKDRATTNGWRPTDTSEAFAAGVLIGAIAKMISRKTTKFASLAQILPKEDVLGSVPQNKSKLNIYENKLDVYNIVDGLLKGAMTIETALNKMRQVVNLEAAKLKIEKGIEKYTALGGKVMTFRQPRQQLPQVDDEIKQQEMEEVKSKIVKNIDSYTMEGNTHSYWNRRKELALVPFTRPKVPRPKSAPPGASPQQPLDPKSQSGKKRH